MDAISSMLKRSETMAGPGDVVRALNASASDALSSIAAGTLYDVLRSGHLLTAFISVMFCGSLVPPALPTPKRPITSRARAICATPWAATAAAGCAAHG